MGRLYSYGELKKFVDGCHGCDLARTRNKAVMGKGNLKADILFIAEAPGNNEDRDGIPFTGKSGVIIDECLESIGLTREDVYITNVVKCHPPANRDPSSEEQERCIEYLRYETALIKPKVIVCLGRIAAMKIIRPDYKISREHGQFIMRMDTWMTAVYHPSAILRDPSKKEEILEDFRKIKEKTEE